MGHTLVTRWTEKDEQHLQAMLVKAGAVNVNKIPFGRPCDRKKADQVLRHHVTLFHWGKEKDAYYLEKLRNYQFPAPCKIWAIRPEWKRAEEGSLLLRLVIRPDPEAERMITALEKQLHLKAEAKLHITLAVSKNHSMIHTLCDEMEKQAFPFPLTVTGLDLYKIWDPVVLVHSF